MARSVVLISCVSEKLEKRAKTSDLYTSTLFRLNLKFARQLNPDAIYILSAKYGLLELDRKIDPYDLMLNKMGVKQIRNWAERVTEQLRGKEDLNNAKFTFLAGERYRRFLVPNLKNVEIPLKGLRIGEQLGKLKELTS